MTTHEQSRPNPESSADAAQPREFEDMIDDQSADSFPASDPPSFTPMASYGQVPGSHKPPTEDEGPAPLPRVYEDPVDDQSDDSFPASDPPSFTPTAGYGRPDSTPE